MCVRDGNQWSHGVVIERFRLFCTKPSSSTLRSPSIDLPLPLRRMRTNLSSCGIRLPLPSSQFLSFNQAPLKKPKKLYTFRCPIAFRATIFIFSCFVEFVFIVVESCCWFGFMFLVCSTPLA
jgi:hypothetical protein